MSATIPDAPDAKLLERRGWPRLSETLEHERRPDRCQACGTDRDLHRWQECDEWDRPSGVLIVLCLVCGETHIPTHPRLYKALPWGAPWPGCMPLCVDCQHRKALRCAHPDLKANGGTGLAIAVAKPIDAMVCTTRSCAHQQLYGSEPSHCAGRETDVGGSTP